MRQTRATRFAVTTCCAGLLAIAGARTARADDDHQRLEAVPEIFIGAAGDCGAGTPAGSHIVTAAWLGGIGLPDNGLDNTTAANLPTNTDASRRDPHRGLLLSKNGPTPDCAAPGATIQGIRNLVVDASFHLGFDYRDGGHCGAGAPRFNVVLKPASGPNTSHFVGGCANGTATPASQDPSEWTQVRFTSAQAFPPLVVGSRVVSIELIFDEGTDTPSTGEPSGVGLAVVDNLDINGQLIRSGSGVADGTDDHRNDDKGGHQDKDKDDRDR